ncbi:MAG: GNAT family N-acetyltransferase [Eubacterium sp.]|nr:GNAT family N-acetyltransferase [Eubacterium sp.]
MIRAIEKKDIPECVKVICESFMTVAKQYDITPENSPAFTAFATDENKILTWMDEQHRPMFGYFEDDKMIGYYNISLPAEKECELGSLSVLPEYRHKGIGKKLLDDSISRARTLGCSIMKLSIVEENTALRQWYEKNGFKHTETRKYDFFSFTCGYLEKEI